MLLLEVLTALKLYPVVELSFKLSRVKTSIVSLYLMWRVFQETKAIKSFLSRRYLRMRTKMSESINIIILPCAFVVALLASCKVGILARICYTLLAFLKAGESN